MAVATTINDILGASPLRADDTRQHRLGQIGRGLNGSEWEYVQFNAGSVVDGHLLAIDRDGVATHVTTAASPRGQRCGVARTSFAIGQFGWLQRRGQANIRVLPNCAANTRLNTTATAGVLDDDGTAASKQIEGIHTQIVNGGVADIREGTLNDPIVGVTI
jgi:hypothetical protein